MTYQNCLLDILSATLLKFIVYFQFDMGDVLIDGNTTGMNLLIA